MTRLGRISNLAATASLKEADEMSDSDQPPPKRVIKEVREVTSSELLRGDTELLIRHGDEVYRLKLTRNGKLILQK